MAKYYKKEYYESFKKYKICTSCKKTKALENKTYCLDCLLIQREKNNKYREKNKKYLKNYLKIWQKERYEKRKKDGICVTCGKRKAYLKFVQCCICRAKDKNKRKGIYNRELYNKCRSCGNPKLYLNFRVCEKCYEKLKKARIKRWYEEDGTKKKPTLKERPIFLGRNWNK